MKSEGIWTKRTLSLCYRIGSHRYRQGSERATVGNLTIFFSSDEKRNLLWQVKTSYSNSITALSWVQIITLNQIKSKLYIPYLKGYCQINCLESKTSRGYQNLGKISWTRIWLNGRFFCICIVNLNINFSFFFMLECDAGNDALKTFRWLRIKERFVLWCDTNFCSLFLPFRGENFGCRTINPSLSLWTFSSCRSACSVRL